MASNYDQDYLGANDPEQDDSAQGQSPVEAALMKRQIAPYESGGITGGQEAKDARKDMPPPFVSQPEPTDATPAVDYTQMGQYANRMGAYNADKFNVPWDQRSEKYQIGTVLSHFDPDKGLTPEVIAALNAANIHGAKFSGSGDKLNVNNVTGYDRFGNGGTADIIGSFKDPNATHNWGAWFVDDNPAGAGGPGGGGTAGPSAMAELLRRRYAGYPAQYPDNQFMNGSLENPVQFGDKPLYTQNPLYQEMMKRLLFTPKQ